MTVSSMAKDHATSPGRRTRCCCLPSLGHHPPTPPPARPTPHRWRVGRLSSSPRRPLQMPAMKVCASPPPPPVPRDIRGHGVRGTQDVAGDRAPFAASLETGGCVRSCNRRATVYDCCRVAVPNRSPLPPRQLCLPHFAGRWLVRYVPHGLGRAVWCCNSQEKQGRRRQRGFQWSWQLCSPRCRSDLSEDLCWRLEIAVLDGLVTTRWGLRAALDRQDTVSCVGKSDKFTCVRCVVCVGVCWNM